MNLKLRDFTQRLVTVLRQTLSQMKDAQLLLVASSLAYTTILSIVPLLALSFAVFKAFGGMQKLYATIEPFIVENLAEGTGDEAVQRLRSFIEATHTTTVGVTGFIGLLATCMLMLNSIESAFNQVWRVTQKRSLFQKISNYWLFITFGPLALSLALGLATSNELPLSSVLPTGGAGFLTAVGALFVIYKFVPNTRVRWIYALAAAVLTSFFGVIARFAYSTYTAHFVSYNRIYGSLGAIPILLVWIYILWLVVLTGAAFSAALQRQYESNRNKKPV